MGNRDKIPVNRWLTPLSFLYGTGVAIRNKLFDWNLLHSEEFDIPILCVGNITAGGTGKTPHTEYLIRLLSSRYRVAVLSRGYKRKTKGYLLAGEKTSAQEIGDEPYQMKRKFPEVTFAVDADRRRGIRNLLKLKPEIEIILLDDAYQHRHVTPGHTILITDYNRLIIHDHLLPAGRLREPLRAKHRADSVIISKCPDNLQAMDIRILIKKLDLYPYQNLYFSGIKYDAPYPLFPENTETVPLSQMSGFPVFAVTGVANPEPMIEYVQKQTGLTEHIRFADHHHFTRQDIEKIEQKVGTYGNTPFYILVTEKDGARLLSNPHVSETLKKHLYCLPLQIYFLQNQTELFNSKILDYVRKNKRNSRVPKKTGTGHS